MTISPDGASVYVAAAESGAIAVFDRAADGALTQKAGLDGCISQTGSGPAPTAGRWPLPAASRPSQDGTSLYAVSADGVAVFDRQLDGTLTQNLDQAGCVSEDRSAAASARPGRGLNGPPPRSP